MNFLSNPNYSNLIRRSRNWGSYTRRWDWWDRALLLQALPYRSHSEAAFLGSLLRPASSYRALA